MYHTYVDTTNAGNVFYVGMGDDARVSRRLGRNKRHTHTAKKHGLNRRVVASFSERQQAVGLEVALIAEHHTFVDDPTYNGIGCNYTKGGEGCACSEETRRKISESKRGQEPWNKGKQVKYELTDEERQRRVAQLVAYNQSRPMLGRRHSDEARARMRKPHRCSKCGEPGHQKRTCKAL